MVDEQRFNEQTLYYEIVSIWGEHGAHADVYKELCRLAGVELNAVSQEESMQHMVQRIYEEKGRNKIRTIKRVRVESPYGFGLKATKELVDRYV